MNLIITEYKCRHVGKTRLTGQKRRVSRVNQKIVQVESEESLIPMISGEEQFCLQP